LRAPPSRGSGGIGLFGVDSRIIKRKIYVFGKMGYIWQNFKIVLMPGRYVGLPDEEDDFDLKERFTALKAELGKQIKDEAIFNERIAETFPKLI
jgi:hypothetical protein